MPTRREFLASGAVVAGAALAGCGDQGGPTDTPAQSMTFASPAFDHSIPTKYACDGEGISPPLTIEGVPNDAASLAVVMDDPDANGYTHWLLWNVPPETTEIPADVPPGERAAELDGAPQGENSAGKLGYVPCCPPPDGGPHTYRFRLYAVGKMLDLDPGASKKTLLDAIDDAGGEWVQFVARYGR
jgi:Raf kinase inhibitor-like YbhB/YbcL family protein